MTIRLKNIAVGFGVLSLNLAFAGDSIRCGNQLVSVGDSRAIVQHRCGAPDDISHSVITKRISDRTYGRVRYADKAEVEVHIEAESWLYNFGANRFMSRLRFVDGRLEHIETLGYGYDRGSLEKAASSDSIEP